MKITDLRFGNYYTYNGKLVFIDIKLMYAFCSGDLNYDPSLLEPIELTEEILLKANYKDLKDGEFLASDNLFYIYKGDDGKFEIFLYQTIQEDVYLKHIKYLHELQNLHFDLGQELDL